jgi:hypothetical protein
VKHKFFSDISVYQSRHLPLIGKVKVRIEFLLEEIVSCVLALMGLSWFTDRRGIRQRERAAGKQSNNILSIYLFNISIKYSKSLNNY